MYMYIYIYTYIHTHTYIYIYIIPINWHRLNGYLDQWAPSLSLASSYRNHASMQGKAFLASPGGLSTHEAKYP